MSKPVSKWKHWEENCWSMWKPSQNVFRLNIPMGLKQIKSKSKNTEDCRVWKKGKKKKLLSCRSSKACLSLDSVKSSFWKTVPWSLPVKKGRHKHHEKLSGRESAISLIERTKSSQQKTSALRPKPLISSLNNYADCRGNQPRQHNWWVRGGEDLFILFPSLSRINTGNIDTLYNVVVRWYFILLQFPGVGVWVSLQFQNPYFQLGEVLSQIPLAYLSLLEQNLIIQYTRTTRTLKLSAPPSWPVKNLSDVSAVLPCDWDVTSPEHHMRTPLTLISEQGSSFLFHSAAS